MWHIFTYIGPGVANTLLLTAVSFAIGAVVAIPVTLAARSRFLPLRWVIRSLVELIRSIPVLVWLFIVFFGLPQYGYTPAPLTAAILTLSGVSAVYLSEIYRGGIAGVSRGQWEASRALGLGQIDMGLRIIAPQVLRVVLPPVATYGIGLLKDSALASTIGVVELTYRANTETQVTGQGLTAYVIAGVIYVLIGLPLAVVSRRVDSRLRAKFSLT
jgi:His/Glu/Gln/Arg/opine family amino acid ABC transporter permease subunit